MSEILKIVYVPDAIRPSLSVPAVTAEWIDHIKKDMANCEAKVGQILANPAPSVLELTDAVKLNFMRHVLAWKLAHPDSNPDEERRASLGIFDRVVINLSEQFESKTLALDSVLKSVQSAKSGLDMLIANLVGANHVAAAIFARRKLLGLYVETKPAAAPVIELPAHFAPADTAPSAPEPRAVAGSSDPSSSEATAVASATMSESAQPGENQPATLKELARELGHSLMRAGTLSYAICRQAVRNYNEYTAARLAKAKAAEEARLEAISAAARAKKEAEAKEQRRIQEEARASRAAEEKRLRETPLLYTRNGTPLFYPIRVTGYAPIAMRSKEHNPVTGYHSAIMIAQELRERGYSEVKMYAFTKERKEYQWGNLGSKGDWLDIPGRG